MSEVKLVIRDANEDRSGTVYGSVADWFIAALSADPVSITELDAAVDRFALESPVRGHLPHFLHCLDAEPWDAGLVVIDLAARLVVIDSSYSSPGSKGTITRHNVQAVEGGSISLRYRLADEWMFLNDALHWEATAETRRQQRAEQPDIDLREVLYGEPMLRFIINGCRRHFARRDDIARRVRIELIERQRDWSARYPNEPQPDPELLTMHELCRAQGPGEDIEHTIYYDTIRDIHADWLLTPCVELNDELPRTVMLRDHVRLSHDMQDREYQWAMLERCPPGISPESHAYQFGGFNTSEVVMYYDYVREVAWSCWDRLRTMSSEELVALETSRIELDRFMSEEVTRLRVVGEVWLDIPWVEGPERTPRGIINLERRRQPDCGQFHPIDPDCLCCQAMAQSSNVVFWHLDGCNMDDLFPFAYNYATIEEWEENQEEYRRFGEQMEQQWKLAEEWNLPPKYSEVPPAFSDVWRLVVTEPRGKIPLGERLNMVGHEVVSILVQLQAATEYCAGLNLERYTETLQFGFAQLRQACENSSPQDVSPHVALSVTRLIDCVDELLADVSGYAGAGSDGHDFEDDDLEDDDSSGDAAADSTCRTLTPGIADSVGTDARLLKRRNRCWRRVSHNCQELRRELRFFTKVSEEEPTGGWCADNIPY